MAAEELELSTSSTDFDKLTGKLENTQETVLGKAKTRATLSGKECTFLWLSTICIVLTLSFTIFKLQETARGTSSTETQNPREERLRDLFLAITLIINLGFLGFYAWHGVFKERKFELWALIAAVIIIGAYILWNFFITTRTTIKIIRLSVFGVGAIPIVILAYLVSNGFRWLGFRIVGADQNRQEKFQCYSQFTTVLLFDLQIAISLLIFVYHPLLNALLAEKVLIPILVVLTLLMAIAVYRGVVTATRWVICAWRVFAVLEPIYIGLKCLHFIWEWNEGIDHMLAGVVYIVAGVAIVVRGFLAYYVDRCFQYFACEPKEQATTTV